MKKRLSFLKAGLIQRLKVLQSINSDRGKSFKNDNNYNSVSYRYLTRNLYCEFDRVGGKDSSDVGLLVDSLNYVNTFGEVGLPGYLSRFKHVGIRNYDYIYQLMSDGNTDYNLLEGRPSLLDLTLSYSDPSMFENVDARFCYENVFNEIGITLPFDKKGMISLSEILGKNNNFGKIDGMYSLKKVILNFFLVSWPLFSTRVLRITFVYFNVDNVVSFEDISNDYDLFKSFGFERVFSRLLILRAVCGRLEDYDFVTSNEDLWIHADFNSEVSSIVKSHFFDSSIEPTKSLSKSSSNPIEQAILLIIYLEGRRNELDFLRRLKEVFDVDPTIIHIINFDVFVKDIDNTRKIPGPDLIFMAAVLNDKTVLKRNVETHKLYGLGGLNGDTDKFFRNQRKHSRSLRVLLSSFKGMTSKCKELVFHLLLRPDVSYLISSQFSTKSDDVGPEAYALGTRLQLVKLIMARSEVDNDYLKKLEEEIKDSIWELHYKADENEGRIKINIGHFVDDVRSFMGRDLDFSLRLPVSYRNEKIYKIQKAGYSEAIAEKIVSYICFGSRYSFNEVLGNKLRHNFLNLRIQKSAKKVLSSHNVDLNHRVFIGTVIESSVKKFCEQWITIYSDRSFFQELTEEVKLIIDDALSGNDSLAEVDCFSVCSRSLKSLEDLLRECRSRWVGEYKNNLKDSIFSFLKENIEDINQAMLDVLSNEMDKAFDESSRWISVNKKNDIECFKVGVHLKFEAKYFDEIGVLDDNISFRTFIDDHRSDDIEMSGDYYELLSCVVENAIGNAIEHSDLKEKTIIEVVYRVANGRLSIEFSNTHTERDDVVARKLEYSIAKMEEYKSTMKLGDKGGTGLIRIDNHLATMFGKDYSLRLDCGRNSYSNFVSLKCDFPLDDRSMDMIYGW